MTHSGYGRLAALDHLDEDRDPSLRYAGGKGVKDANGPTGVFGNLNYLAFATDGTLTERGLEPVDHPWHGSWAAARALASAGVGSLTQGRGLPLTRSQTSLERAE